MCLLYHNSKSISQAVNVSQANRIKYNRLLLDLSILWVVSPENEWYNINQFWQYLWILHKQGSNWKNICQFLISPHYFLHKNNPLRTTFTILNQKEFKPNFSSPQINVLVTRVGRTFSLQLVFLTTTTWFHQASQLIVFKVMKTEPILN